MHTCNIVTAANGRLMIDNPEKTQLFSSMSCPSLQSEIVPKIQTKSASGSSNTTRAPDSEIAGTSYQKEISPVKRLGYVDESHRAQVFPSSFNGFK